MTALPFLHGNCRPRSKWEIEALISTALSPSYTTQIVAE